MWPLIKRWRDWAMYDLFARPRLGPQPQALHHSFEKGGLTLPGQPVPWNAEAVLVEALVRLPTSVPRRKSAFQLRLGGGEPVQADNLRREETEDRHRLVFRFPPPARSCVAEVLYGSHVLGQLPIPVLTQADFTQQLRLHMPTLFVRLGDQSVACQTFVATQGRGLIASALLQSPTSLVPLLDLGLQVEFKSERTGQSHVVPARLCSSQLAGRQALVTVVPPRFPRRLGTWTATWMLGESTLASHRVRAISQKTFQRSLRVSDTRFVIRTEKEGVILTRHIPQLDASARVGPCFLVSSREPGMAGFCTLQVRAQVPGAVQALPLLEQHILITDGPTMFAPGTIESGDLAQVTSFELRLKNESLGSLSLCPAPAAAFNAEGGFKPTPEFNWSAAADEELADRLGRLLEGRGPE